MQPWSDFRTRKKIKKKILTLYSKNYSKELPREKVIGNCQSKLSREVNSNGRNKVDIFQKLMPK